MRRPLQDFSESAYERPTLPWICGLAEAGHSCATGPSRRGTCPMSAQCAPVRVGDRWQCKRSPLRGGPCDVGPAPDGTCPNVDRCQPARSLRRRRGRIAAACAVVTLGGLLIGFSAKSRDLWLVPGRLAQNHAQILTNKQGTERCATCHEVAGKQAGQWLSAAISRPADEQNQSQRCMECHEHSIDSKFALFAHSTAPARLDEITAQRPGRTDLVRLIGGNPVNRHGEIACAACHQEHRGRHHDLTAMDNARCQACHAERYHSFATDHPDFNVWPYDRRTRIVFDHATHLQKHFPKEDANFDCNRCHVDDRTKSVKLLADFERSCAACHEEPISTSLGRGVPILLLPMIDVDLLQDVGIEVGDWPEWATGEFDGRLPPPMKLLLAADPQAAEAFKVLGEDFEFGDIDFEDESQLQAAGQLAVAIKRLLAELSEGGRAAGAKRLSKVLEAPVSPEDSDLLFAGFSADLVRMAQQEWFHTTEDKDEDNATPPIGTKPTLHPAQGELYDLLLAPAGAWLRDDRAFKLFYQPAGHADPLLTSWITCIAKSTTGTADENLQAALRELAGSTSPGMCGSCHSVDRLAPGPLTVNWRAYDRTTQARGFITFTHQPHLIQPALADCTACHQVDKRSNSAVSYADRDPHSFASDFMPMSKQHCAECHTANAAGDRCTACHHYHVQRP